MSVETTLTRRVEYSPTVKHTQRSAIGVYFDHAHVMLQIRFLVQGPKGATQFLVHCGPSGVMPYDKGFHAVEPQDYQTADDRRECTYLPSGYCYYDGSGLNAYDTFAKWVEGGDEAMWADLEAYYHGLFDAAEETVEQLS